MVEALIDVGSSSMHFIAHVSTFSFLIASIWRFLRHERDSLLYQMERWIPQFFSSFSIVYIIEIR